MTERVLSKREKSILIFTAGVILAALTVNLIIIPLLIQSSRLNNEIRFAQAKVAKYKWLISNKESLRKQYPLPKPQASGRPDTVTGTLEEIEQIASSAGIRITDIRPDMQGRQMQIEMRADGNMEGYINLIYNLESSLLLFNIQECAFTMNSRGKLLEGVFKISRSP